MTLPSPWESLGRGGPEPSGGRAWAQISMGNLRHNLEVLRGALPQGCAVMAVVKADAYGHGDIEVSRQLNEMGVGAFAVATLDEGVRLRRGGVRGEILILGYTPGSGAAALRRYGLTQTVVDAEHARELDGCGVPLPVHLKIDTGMNRLGESFSHLQRILWVFGCANLRVTGIFTHLSAPDSPDGGDIAFTRGQIGDFYSLLEQLKARGIRLPKVHIQSSFGVLCNPDLRCHYARIGIALFGALSGPGPAGELRPVLALRSRVSLVRTVEAGGSVGYGRAFVAPGERKIAVVSIGYADGYPRSLSQGRGQVLIGGRRAPVAGRVCMDQLMADVTSLPEVRRGDVVTLIGGDGSEEIRAEQVAADAGTIANELLSRLGPRLERVYVPAGDYDSLSFLYNPLSRAHQALHCSNAKGGSPQME